ncbi:MAG TPA: hypothetical protein ENN17_01075 [bacterium]|nr:hypothetical protein [bacterium]
MALKKSEKRILVILGVVIAIFLLDRFVLSGGDKKEPPRPATTRETRRTVTTPAEEPVQKREAGPKVRYDNWGRDPFTFLDPTRQQTAAQLEASLDLKGIIRKGGKIFVLINGYIIAEGEEKEGIRVERIEGNQVFCVKDGRRITLEWKG